MLSNDLTVCQEAIIVTSSVLSGITSDSLQKYLSVDELVLPQLFSQAVKMVNHGLLF